jgi:pimeloyl-ACP methyl ester carboxylesterase
MIVKKNEVLNAEGCKPILYDLYYLPTKSYKEIVIFCHGYKGFKDWGAWNLVAESFAESGFIFLKFNFSHNGGTVTEPIDFPDLEAFAQNNYSHELNDLDRVLDFAQSEFNNLKINLIGHSRGGGITLIKSSKDKRINKVITWAGVSDFKARFQVGTSDFERWRTTGITHVENSRTKQQMPHYFQFYEDFKRNETLLNIKSAVQELRIPQLIVHGENDPTVPLQEAKALHKWNTASKLEIIANGNHVFGAEHPWEKSALPHDLQTVTKLSIDFITRT